MNHIEINNIHKMILQLLKPDKDMIDTYLSRIKQLKNVKMRMGKNNGLTKWSIED